MDRTPVDLIHPYKTIREVHDDPFIIKALSMIYPATRWFEIVRYNEKTDTIENLGEKTWLCIYPCPEIITYVRENEFLGHPFKNDLIER